MNTKTASREPSSALDGYASTGLTGWRGTFTEFRDCQTIGTSLVCSDFEMRIAGEWWPVDWGRFRRTHPDDWRQITEFVRSKESSEA